MQSTESRCNQLKLGHPPYVYILRDAYNLDEHWVSDTFTWLNHAPITVRSESYRTGLIVQNFVCTPEIGEMLKGLEVETGKR